MMPARRDTAASGLIVGLVWALNAGCSENPSAPLQDAAQVVDGRLAVADASTADSVAVDGDGEGRDATASDGAGDDGALVGDGTCAALPAPSGAVIDVVPAQAGELVSIVAGATSGTTILLQDGTYVMSGGESSRRLQFKVPDVTLRSASGNPDAVVIDGEYQTNEMISIAADEVTIADITLKRAVDHLIHITGAATKTIEGVRLYNLVLIDSGEQFVKVNPNAQGYYADKGWLECSRLRMTAAGRPHVEPNPGGCYTGGIDAHGAWGWQVRFNRFEGIYCTNGSLAEHAIHFWSASRDTLVERNTIIDCARGIGFGLVESGKVRDYDDDPYPGTGYIGHYDGIIRNNVIHAGLAASPYFDTGIELDQARGAKVYHNTSVSQPTFSSIDYRFANTLVEIRNNLTFRITQRNGASGSVGPNLEATPANLFVDAPQVDYRLRSNADQAINKGVVLSEAGLDLQGNQHDVGPPDLGAYEYLP